jgi:S-formylglutathione hydrolase FrmB
VCGGETLNWLTDLWLVSGLVPIAVTVVGCIGAIWLLSGRPRWFTHRAIPIAAAVTGASIGALYVVVEKWWRPFPNVMPTTVYLWIAAGIGGLALLFPRIRSSSGWRARAVTVAAAVVVVLAAAVQINSFYGQFPTVGAALGLPEHDRIDFAAVPGPTLATIAGHPLDSVWAPTHGQQPDGRVTRAAIRGVRSGFSARAAQIYLPPAYFADPRPLLPVLVLLTGEPGDPSDWLIGGKLSATMDAFAARHAGLAPVVVVADADGARWHNPMCMDSRLGNVATYLAVDVPEWTKAHLQVDPDPQAWAIGGLSSGGTCALQIEANYPQTYPTFLDFSGATEPSLGDHRRSVQAAFGGDESAFRRVNPTELLRTHRYPNSAGIFVVGSRDKEYKADQEAMYHAAKRAGMDVSYAEYPGGHSWLVWSAALRGEIGWLARRLGLIG